MKVIKNIGCKLFTSCVCLAMSGAVLAQSSGKLPTMEDPSRGQGSGIRQTAQNYLYDGGILIGLVIAVLGFLAVAWHAIAVFSEVQHGKKKWSDFGAVLIIGIVLIILAIWLLTKAAEIL